MGASIAILGSLPPKLTGAMSVQIAEDLSFSVATLGTTVAILHAAGALAAIPLGRFADWLGSTRSIRLTAAVGAIAFLGIGSLAVNWITLVALLSVAEISGKLASPAANRLLIGKVPSSKLGAAFGLKQSSGPIAGMVAGLSVPVIAVTVGWRWAFAVGGVYALTLAFAARRTSPGTRPVRQRQKVRTVLPHRPLLSILALAFGLQGAATTLLAVFYVPSAVDAGVSAGAAGLLLAVSSGGAMLVRILAGRLCDRMASGHLRVAAVLLLIGSLGIGLLAVGSPGTMITGIILALGSAWGQPGVFWFSVVRFYRDTPGRVTGLISPANNVGSIVGPFAFGLLVTALGYTVAWAFCGGLAIAGAFAMLAANRRMVRLGDAPA